MDETPAHAMLQRDYLGDGLYVHFDGYQIWLTTQRENGQHAIALEPSTYVALQNYVKRVWPKQKKGPKS